MAFSLWQRIFEVVHDYAGLKQLADRNRIRKPSDDKRKRRFAWFSGDHRTRWWFPISQYGLVRLVDLSEG